MNITKCKGCGKLFPRGTTAFCLDCMNKLDEDYRTVREYIYDHPDANVQQTAEATEVAEWEIVYYLKESRLTLRGETGYLRCEQCGRPIDSGHLCDSCLSMFGTRLNDGLRQQEMLRRQQEEAKRQGVTMHTYKNYDEK